MGISILLFLLLVVQGSTVAQESSERTDFLYGERLFNERLHDLAVIQFGNFVVNYPTSPSADKAQFYIAESWFFLKKYEEAQKAYLQLLVRYPTSLHTDQGQFRMGECFEKQNKKKEAIESYLRLASLYPQSTKKSEALYRSGLLSRELGNTRRAESILRSLIELTKEGEYRSKAIFLLSKCVSDKGDYENGIQLLKPLITQPIQKEDPGEAAYQIGLLYETLGYFNESQNYFRTVLESTENEAIRQKAQFHLGSQFRLEGQYNQALNALRETVILGNDDDLKCRALFLQGRMFEQTGEYQSALRAFEDASVRGSLTDIKNQSRYKKAICLQSLGQSADAIAVLESLAQDTRLEDRVLKKTLLKLAQMTRNKQEYLEAAGYYDHYLARFENDPLLDLVLLQEGKIYLQEMELWTEGLLTLQSIWKRFANSPHIPEARYVSGQYLERLERNEEATQMYRILLKQYPGSYWSQKASIDLQTLEKTNSVHLKKALSDLTRLLQQSITGEAGADVLFDLGYLSFQYLSQFQNAIQYFSQYLREHPDGSKKEEALLYLAQCYKVSHEETRNETFLDSALSTYSALLTQFPQSAFIPEAALAMIQINKDQPLDSLLTKYTHYLEQYPDSQHNGDVLFQIGMINLERDSLQRALNHFSGLHTILPQSNQAEEALWQTGLIYTYLEKMAEADSIFNNYMKLYPNGSHTAESLIHRAKIAELKEEWSRALSFYESITRRFNYSSWADSIFVPLGDLYLRTRKYQKAVDFFHGALQQDSLARWAATIDLRPVKPSFRKDYLYGLAKGYEGLKQYKKAKIHYLQYGREYTDGGDQIRFLLALASIAENEEKSVRAVDYLNRVIQLAPSDSTADALAMLYYRLSDYENAVYTYERALSLATNKEKQADLSSRIIVSLLRQGKIPQADVRIDIFNKSFKKNPGLQDYQAEFLYEKGVAYINKKDFEPAIESLERILQRYKKSSYVPEAELEIGRAYLITNKVEEALSILTSMVDRYAGQPILAKVYLNLGDFYFRSQQYENAMRAFKLTIEERRMEDVIPTAMRYLIRVYKTLRLWDAALGLTRDYIRQYPSADDVLQKRVDIGIFYMELSEFGRAAEYLREVKLDADSETEAQIQYWIGKCYYNMGQFEQAIFEFLKVNYLSKPTKLPWATTAMYDAGLSYMKLDNAVQAQRLFEKIVKKEGATSDLGRIARQRIEEINSGTNIK